MRTILTATAWVCAAVAIACGGETSANDSDSSSEAGTTAPSCTPGSEGCACAAGSCDGDLACYSNICVVPPSGESSSTAAASTSTGDAESSSEASSSGGDTSTSSSSDGGSSSSNGDSSTTEAAALCFEGNHVCEAGELQTCTEGAWVSSSCEEACAPSGYGSTGCADINGCACAGFIDAECIAVVEAFCFCWELANWGTCTETTETTAYESCLDPSDNDHELYLCIASSGGTDSASCNAGISGCF